jgi:hypothetical protein
MVRVECPTRPVARQDFFAPAKNGNFRIGRGARRRSDYVPDVLNVSDDVNRDIRCSISIAQNVEHFQQVVIGGLKVLRNLGMLLFGQLHRLFPFDPPVVWADLRCLPI